MLKARLVVGKLLNGLTFDLDGVDAAVLHEL